MQVAKKAYRSVIIITPEPAGPPTDAEIELIAEIKRRTKKNYKYSYKDNETVKLKISTTVEIPIFFIVSQIMLFAGSINVF